MVFTADVPVGTTSLSLRVWLMGIHNGCYYICMFNMLAVTLLATTPNKQQSHWVYLSVPARGSLICIFDIIKLVSFLATLFHLRLDSDLETSGMEHGCGQN